MNGEYGQAGADTQPVADGDVFGLVYLAAAFTGLECIVWGLHVWVIMYLYVWPLLITAALMLNEKGSVLTFSLLSAFFGLFFGLACSLPYLFISGPAAAFAWWVSGIPFDIVHCVSNFLLCLILFRPLDLLLLNLKNRF